MLKSLWALLALLSLSLPLLAMQGTSVGTLPNRSVNHNVGWLSAWQRITLTQGEASLAIGSTHDAEENLGDTQGEDPQVYHQSWTSHGMKVDVETKRWVSEEGPDGARRWAARHAQAVSEARYLWPPDSLAFLLHQAQPRWRVA